MEYVSVAAAIVAIASYTASSHRISAVVVVLATTILQSAEEKRVQVTGRLGGNSPSLFGTCRPHSDGQNVLEILKSFGLGTFPQIIEQ